MGADFEEEKPLAPEPVIEKQETPTLFGDPKSYEHLSMDERIEMTKRMKSNIMSQITLGQRK